MVSLRILFVLISFIILINLYAQTGVDTIVYVNVLLKNQKGKEFVFDYSKGEIADKTSLIYLGNVSTKQGKTYKVITSVWVSGYSKRGTTKILLFDTKNKYVGNFVLGMTYEAPTKVRQNNLIFEFSKGKGCDYTLKREVNFTNGIPKQFFLECKNGMGDLFYFDATKS